MFTLAEIRISGKLLKSILCLAFTLSPLALTAQHNNQYAYVAIADSGQVFGYRLNATNGNLTSVEGSPFPNSNYAGLSSIAADPAGRFLYATSQYAPDNKNVIGFRIDRPTGRLCPLPGSPFGAGAVASAIAIDPSGRFAYVANYGGSSVSAFKIDQRDGGLLPIASYAAGSNPDAVTVDPLGKFVYLANLSSNDVSGYAINQATGALTQITGSPFPTGTGPRSLAVDPNERFVYVANQGSDGDIPSMQPAAHSRTWARRPMPSETPVFHPWSLPRPALRSMWPVMAACTSIPLTRTAKTSLASLFRQTCMASSHKLQAHRLEGDRLTSYPSTTPEPFYTRPTTMTFQASTSAPVF